MNKPLGVVFFLKMFIFEQNQNLIQAEDVTPLALCAESVVNNERIKTLFFFCL